MQDLPIVIIGAGIGGLSAAIRLAASGRDVIIFEQNAEPGGKMSRLQAEGFTWDRGPSVITMRHVFEELFTSAGRRIEDYLTLETVEPLTRYFYPDSTVLDATRDLPGMLARIQSIEPRDVEGYLSFLAYAARLHRITGPVFIYDQPPTWRSFLRVSFRDWFRIDGLRTMDAAIRGYLHSPKLQQFLGRFATYTGASPYLAPATLNVIAHVELNEGVWYPRGGIYEIASALSKLPADDPTIYVAITSKTDIEHAPQGCENWFVLVNAPPLGSNYDWSAQAAAYRELLLNRLSARGYDLRPDLRYEAMITPLDLQRETGGWLGALYGASSHNRWAAFRRPHNRDKELRGLYFVGGSTHPGGGVPMVTLSGKVVAEMVLDDSD